MPASEAGSAAKDALKRISAVKAGKILFNEIPEDDFARRRSPTTSS